MIRGSTSAGYWLADSLFVCSIKSGAISTVDKDIAFWNIAVSERRKIPAPACKLSLKPYDNINRAQNTKYPIIPVGGTQ